MKTEHRHELKTNELADWLMNSPQWVRQNLKIIIYVSAAVVLIAASYLYYKYQKDVVSVRKKVELTELIARLPQNKLEILQSLSKGIDNSYVLIQAADSLQSIAQTTKDSRMAALALIKQAESLRMELNYRPGIITEQDFKSQLNKAKTVYAEALDKAAGNPSLSAAAKFGTGLCEEELGSFGEAEQIYRYIAADPNFEGTTSAVQASLRLENMADLQKKITFRQVPPPAPEVKVTEPQIQLKPPDIDAMLNPLNLPPPK